VIESVVADGMSFVPDTFKYFGMFADIVTNAKECCPAIESF
jgi:hypothetical protein